MDRNTRYIVRLMFQTKVYSCDGAAFESFFTHIMQRHNRNFQQVKPQGQYGDRKNDGLIKQQVLIIKYMLLKILR